MVARVKPAVISVQFGWNEVSNASDLSSDSEDNSPSGSPSEKFFQQHGSDEAPGGMPQRHEVVFGAGSGFSFQLTATP